MKYMLAPMEDITSAAFRTLAYNFGADLTFTELARIESIVRNNKSTVLRTQIFDDVPTCIQLLGSKEIYFKKFLSSFKPDKGFKGFNLNLGCPSPNIVNIGQGCAMVRRITKTKKIVEIFKDRSYPISIKMRLGANALDVQRKIYLNLINSVDADYFIVHARHGGQSYNEPADHKSLFECNSTGRKIVANGDIAITNHQEFKDFYGIMLGREAIKDPTIFSKIKKLEIISKDIKGDYDLLSRKYNEPFKYIKNISKFMIN